MVAMRVRQFQGRVPRTSPEELQMNEGQVATNCRLWNKKLSPWNGLLNQATVAGGVKSVFNLRGHWIGFTSDVDVAPSQLSGDHTGRIFYTGLDRPRMTTLSRAIIGQTAIYTLANDSPTSADKVLPAELIHDTLVNLGLVIGDTVNASCQIVDGTAAVVNGRVQIKFLDGGGATLSTVNGSNVQGCGEYEVSLLTSVVIPASTVSLQVWAVADSAGTTASARVPYLTKGNFSAGPLPIASTILGVPSPTAPVASQVKATVNITGATSHAAAISNGTTPTLSCDGTEVVCIGTVSFSQSVGQQVNGNVTVNLLSGGVVVDSKDFPFDCRGTPTEPHTGRISGSFTLKDQPTSGNHTYSLSVTTDFGGGTGGGSPVFTVKGRISYNGVVDVTVTGWAANNVQHIGDIIVDPNGNMQYLLNGDGNATGSGAPAFSKVYGGTTADGGVTWVCISTLPNGTPLFIGGVKGMTDLNNHTWTVLSVTANVIRVNCTSQKVYSSGGTCSINFTTLQSEANAEDRVYALTYLVNLDGQVFESKASVASHVVTAEPGRTISIVLPVTPSGQFITGLNIYRTVADGQGGATLIFVDTVATTDGTTPLAYVDTKSDTLLSGALPSSDWNAPPADLKGLVNLPNGVTVGFTANTIIPSVPFQPQAYPVEYQLSTQFDIVAIKPFGQSLAVMTAGKPYVIVGPDPSQWLMEAIDTIQPCLAKRSAVDMGTGVVYSCPDGLTMLSTAGLELLTENFITADVWAAMDPTSIIGAYYAGCYVGFYSGNGGGGFIFDPSDAESTWTDLNFQATAVWNDPVTANLYVVVGTSLSLFDGDGANPMTFTWQSRDQVFAKPVNLGRAKVRATAYPVTLKVYADGALKFTVAVADDQIIALPAGFRAKRWSFSVSGTSTVREVILGESVDDIIQAAAA